MAGRPQFEEVVAQAPKMSLFQVISQNTDSLPAGQSETVYVYAPTNTVGRVNGLAMMCAAPSNGGATSGTHRFLVSYKVTSSGMNIDIIRGQSNYNTNLTFNMGEWLEADVYQNPAGESQAAISNMAFDEDMPLFIAYQNASDVATSQQRNVYLAITSEEVAKG